MNGASKILTVSYGTFSCTLEGFDDPFNTMKAIAEYFRDLAAGDRYFGAEPPTPDAAMLHRIAEREIQRRVEAKIQENGVVLRASDGAEPLAAPVPVAAAPAVTADPVAAVAVPVSAPVVQPEAPAVQPASAAMAETVAEKLSRLRSEVAAQPAVQPPAVTMPAVSFAIPDYVEDDVSDLVTTTRPEEPVATAAEGIAAAETADEDYLPEAWSDDAPEEGLALADDLALALAADEAAEARPAPVLPEETDLGEAADALPGSVLAALAASAEEAIGADEGDGVSSERDMAEQAAPAPVALPDMAEDGSAEDDAALLAAIGGLDDMAAAPQDAAPVAPSLAELAEVDAVTDDLQDADAEEPVPAIVIEGLAHPPAGETVPDAADEIPAIDAGETSVATETRPGAVEKAQRARARVIRIRRGEPDPEAEAAPLSIFAEVEDEPAPAKAAPVVAEETAAAGIEALLSAEDEAELQRELAALRANDQDIVADTPDEVSRLVIQQESRRGFDGPSADEALGRLMQQTDTEMEGSDIKRRQSAIAHLKAAVAATVAERKVTGEAANDTATVSRLARYRDDLARVVKSALPGRGATTAAPSGDRPAPLVLVSEQRIDRPRALPAAQPSAAAGPIRPRRVTAAMGGLRAAGEIAQLAMEEEEDEDDQTGAADVAAVPQGFAEFVEKVGAQSLEEVLEASAAYLAGVEGLPQFSRPQLMRRVSAVMPGGTLQREDGLRSFGTLLRDGRIAKVRRGLFTLSDGSAYLAEARKIAG